MDMTNGITILDNSTLAALASCETEAAVKYLLHRVPTRPKAEDAAREAGKAVHAGIAHYLRGGTIDEAMRVIEVMYKGFATREVPQDDRRLQWANVEKCAWSWFDRHSFAALPFEPVEDLIEVPFAVQVKDNLWLTGLLDGVVRDKVSRQYYVLETKTTGQKADWWMKQWRLASQVSHYTYCAPRAEAVKRVLGDVTFAGVYVNKVDMSLLPTPYYLKSGKEGLCNRGNNSHGVPYSECWPMHAQHMIQEYKRRQDLLDAWLGSVLELHNKWQVITHDIQTLDDVREKGIQEGLFNGSCVFCDLNDWCATGRKNQAVLKEAKWGPIQPEAILNPTAIQRRS